MSEQDVHDSCLVEKLSRYISLDEASLGYISVLEKEEKQFDRHSEVNAPGGPRIVCMW